MEVGTPHFDYIIIGSGLAGLQLALKLAQDPFFNHCSIGLIDPSTKSENDKTWSFWEKGAGQFDSIVEQQWSQAQFISPKVSLDLPLQEYQYKTIKSLKFYNYCKSILSQHRRISFVQDEVLHIQENEKLNIHTRKGTYTAGHVFDSRPPQDYFKLAHQYTLIHQHFKGWFIKTKHPRFDTRAIRMMDYRYQYGHSTSFMYLLPFTETEALVEYTFFTPYLVDRKVYADKLKIYLQEEFGLNDGDYSIREEETGNIPMTDFPFWNYHTRGVTKIGTGGGWVKGSSGYSFKHSMHNATCIAENLKANRIPSHGLVNRKFKFYDKIFLRVLKDHNEKGVWIFEQFYGKNKIGTMFRFLDEESNFSEDLRIMKSLFSKYFIQAFFKILFRIN